MKDDRRELLETEEEELFEDLKQFVQRHPNQQMAWYLLGREYAAQGKMAKARYCFARAGEVYEAFENRVIKVDPAVLAAAEEAARRRGDSEKPGRPSRRWRGTLLVALLALLLIPITGDERRTPVHLTVEKADKTALAEARAISEKPVVGSEPKAVVYYADRAVQRRAGGAQTGRGERLREEMSHLLFASGEGAPEALIVAGEAAGEGEWSAWYRPTVLIASVKQGADRDKQRIEHYDAETCACKPANSAHARAMAAEWRGRQEQLLVLSSAVEAFYRRNSRMPNKAEELTGNYPDNIIPGMTPYMETMFSKIREEVHTKLGMNKEAEPAKSGPAKWLATSVKPEHVEDQLFKEPLRIVVDRRAYRLAVISGNTIIRTFPVGLGGEKTPDGEFTITEKVRDPNGKSNGEFGSRGMTLSDTLYAIHGTNEPDSIGQDESKGCIRMGKEDVEELFDLVPLETRVTIGRDLLPVLSEGDPSEPRWSLPGKAVETNPQKVYKWLN
jgi:lipoprotein-anchoring transpeptidase ErfK/SrfK